MADEKQVKTPEQKAKELNQFSKQYGQMPEDVRQRPGFQRERKEEAQRRGLLTQEPKEPKVPAFQRKIDRKQQYLQGHPELQRTGEQ